MHLDDQDALLVLEMAGLWRVLYISLSLPHLWQLFRVCLYLFHS